MTEARRYALQLLRLIFVCCGAWLFLHAQAQELQQQSPREYQLAAGDSIRVLVFQNVDLTLETRVSENGSITFPLIGSVQISNLSISAAEKKIANALESGGFIKNPQVNIVLLQMIGNQVPVLGYVLRPGSYPLPTTNTRVSQMLATAGGSVLGANAAIVIGERNGQPFRKLVDIAAIYLDGKIEDDIVLNSGDSIYVPKPATFYVYGEVQKPGGYPLDRNMSVAQGLALGGGPSPRGTERGLLIKRRDAQGMEHQIKPRMDDLLQPDDVLFVKESLF